MGGQGMGDGGAGYSGGGGAGNSFAGAGGANGGNGHDGSWGKGGVGTGEDISLYNFTSWTLSPGIGGKSYIVTASTMVAEVVGYG